MIIPHSRRSQIPTKLPVKCIASDVISNFRKSLLGSPAFGASFLDTQLQFFGITECSQDQYGFLENFSCLT